MLRLLIGLLGTLAAVPAIAAAQPDRCLHEKRSDEIVGALVGAGVGALIGNTVTHGGVGATVAGGAAGGAAGALAGGASARCGQNRYGYYDAAGRWVPERVTAYGYYGPDGHWVAGRPPGYATAVDAAAAPAWSGGDTRAREQALEAALERRMDQGTLPARDGRRALRDLRDIGATDTAYRRDDGRLTPDQRRDVEGRLDELAARMGVGGEAGR
jgi:hypothetical protein